MISFDIIPEDKRQRILNAALHEFADKGYARASTNTIVTDAAIAKGLLFHYFKTKKQLYLALYNYGIQTSLAELYSRLDLEQGDIISRLRHIQAIKLEMLGRNPDIFSFLQSAYLEQDAHVSEDIKVLGQKLLAENLARIYSNLDFSVLKEDINPARALQIILWTMDGFIDELLARARQKGVPVDYPEAFREMDAYLDTLQQCLYR
ncbi:MAG: TetR/AcrR family transcriptional regulator [Anaerolineae bacterium]